MTVQIDFDHGTYIHDHKLNRTYKVDSSHVSILDEDVWNYDVILCSACKKSNAVYNENGESDHFLCLKCLKFYFGPKWHDFLSRHDIRGRLTAILEGLLKKYFPESAHGERN